MRILWFLGTVLFAFSIVAAREQSDWREFRSEAEGFSIELPGTPKALLATWATVKRKSLSQLSQARKLTW